MTNPFQGLFDEHPKLPNGAELPEGAEVSGITAECSHCHRDLLRVHVIDLDPHVWIIPGTDCPQCRNQTEAALRALKEATPEVKLRHGRQPDQAHSCYLMKVVLFECRLDKKVRIVRFGASWRFECSIVDDPVIDLERVSTPIVFCPFCQSNLALEFDPDEPIADVAKRGDAIMERMFGTPPEDFT